MEPKPELLQAINFWLENDKMKKSRDEIKRLQEAKDYDALEKCLMTRMQFGTAGLRDKMAAGNAHMNDLTILQTTQGLCQHIKSKFGKSVRDKGIVIGFDARHNSERFSKRIANVFICEKIKVYRFSDIVPTPFVAYAVNMYQACAGIMVTASHNPKQDNGYKVYWDNGSQIVPPHDSMIADQIEKNLKVCDQFWDTEFLTSSPLICDPFADVYEEYFTRLAKLCKNRQINKKTDLRFVYTPVHGVGLRFAKQAFASFSLPEFFPVEKQMLPDPEFSTVEYPNPEEGEGTLKLAFETAEENGCTIVLANDPDADRLAVAEKQDDGIWKLFTGNELGALLGWWAFYQYQQANLRYEKKDVWMISSTVSSMILKSIAEKEGIRFEDTLTGFKWMGNSAFAHLRKGHLVLFAFEEAIGFMFGTNVLDKDGVSALAVMAELACYLKHTRCMNLKTKLEEIYERYGQHISNNSYFICHEKEKIDQMFHRLRHYDGKSAISSAKHNYPAQVGRFPITAVRDVTTGFDSRTENKTSRLPMTPESHMLTFYFENGTVLTLRTSGTEPKIKYYSEICSQGDPIELRKELAELVDEMIKEFYEPEKNGFLARTT